MINLSTSGNAVVFTFTDSDRYLYGTGTITVPLNSLLLVTDNSQMATFKKAASNDVFVSALYSELGMTKDELISWFETNAVGSTGGGGGGGITSGDVQTMIDESISGKVDTSAFDTYSAATNTELNNKLIDVRSNSATYAGNGVTTIDISKNGSSYTTRTYVASINNQPILTGSDYTKANKFSLVETSAITQSVTSASTDSEIPSAKAVWDAIPASITVDSTFDSGSTNPLANSAITTHLNDVESIIATSLVDLDTRKLDASAYTPTDLSNYYTSAQTESAITAAVSGKQDTLVAGDNITISGNVISAEGGGGASYSAGTNISIDTANTISCTLPISADSKGIYTTSTYPFEGTSIKSQNVVFGLRNKIYKNGASSFCTDNLIFGVDNNIGTGEIAATNLRYNFVGGDNNKIYGDSSVSSSFIIGYRNEIRNSYETAFGEYNVSNTGSSTSAKTLFSVGNGTSTNARHNAFEIRQNGDIYCSDGTNDVKLQDYIQFKIAKLSQSEYDALVQGGTVDANTVYFITNSNS